MGNAVQSIQWIVFRNIQEVFLRNRKIEPYKEEIDSVMNVYDDDLDIEKLDAQLDDLMMMQVIYQSFCSSYQ